MLTLDEGKWSVSHPGRFTPGSNAPLVLWVRGYLESNHGFSILQHVAFIHRTDSVIPAPVLCAEDLIKPVYCQNLTKPTHTTYRPNIFDVFTKYSLHLSLYFQGIPVKIRDVNSLQMLTLAGLKSTLVNGENRNLNSGLSTMLCVVRQSTVSNPAAARPQRVILWQQQLIRTWVYSRLGNKWFALAVRNLRACVQDGSSRGTAAVLGQWCAPRLF